MIKATSIKIADYLDDYGDLNTFALNSDIRLTLEIDSDAADKLNSYDNAWANLDLRSATDENGNSSYLSLRANDHDNDYEDDNPGFSGSDNDVTSYVETNDSGGTSYELTLEEWSIENAARNLEEGQSSETFTLSWVSASFDTLSGNYYQSLNNDQVSQLTDSIQSITIDFSGYDPGEFNDGDGGDVSFPLILLQMLSIYPWLITTKMSSSTSNQMVLITADSGQVIP